MDRDGDFSFVFTPSLSVSPSSSPSAPSSPASGLPSNPAPAPSPSLRHSNPSTPIISSFATASKSAKASSKERTRSGSLGRGYDFQLPLSSLPPRGLTVHSNGSHHTALLSPSKSGGEELRSPGSGRSVTSAESEPEPQRPFEFNVSLSAPAAIPRPRSQSLSVTIMQNKAPNGLPRPTLTLPTTTSPRPNTHLPSPRASHSPRNQPSGHSPRNSSPRSTPGNQSPRLNHSPRNSSPRSQPKGDKRFPCPVPFCDAGYARRTVLLRHFNTKHGHLLNLYPDMKPDEIACPVPGCVSTFLRKGNLIHHYRRFHPEQTYQQHSSFRWIIENESGDPTGDMDFGEDYGEDMMMDDMHEDGMGDQYSTSDFSLQFRDYVLDEASLLSVPSDSFSSASSTMSSSHVDDRPSIANSNPNSNANYDPYQQGITQSNPTPRTNSMATNQGYNNGYHTNPSNHLSFTSAPNFASNNPSTHFYNNAPHAASNSNPNSLPAHLFNAPSNPSTASNSFRPTSALLPAMYTTDPSTFSSAVSFPSPNDFLTATMRSASDEMILSALRPFEDGVGRVPSDESLQLAAIANNMMDYTLQ